MRLQGVKTRLSSTSGKHSNIYIYNVMYTNVCDTLSVKQLSFDSMIQGYQCLYSFLLSMYTSQLNSGSTVLIYSVYILFYCYEKNLYFYILNGLIAHCESLAVLCAFLLFG